MSSKEKELDRLYHTLHKLCELEDNPYIRFVYDYCNDFTTGSDDIDSNINVIMEAINKISKSSNN